MINEGGMGVWVGQCNLAKENQDVFLDGL